jgi:hypothetical protein
VTIETIFVPLKDEGTEVWAPASGERLPDGTFYLIGPAPSDQAWAFPPGAIVTVASKRFAEGAVGLAAIALAN